MDLSENPLFKKVLNAGKKAFKHLQSKGSYRPEDIGEKPYQDLIRATHKVFSYAITDNVVSPTLAAALQNDAFLFGGLKTHAQLFEASKLLLDENGKIKTWSNLEQEFDRLNIEYNRNYLEAEYQFALQSAISADQWHETSDRYDLQYRTASDDKVREEHRMLHDITLPKDSPFWIEFYPPNGWRCRCRAIQVRKGKYPESDSEDAFKKGREATMQIGRDGKNRLEIFRFNSGMIQKLMPPEHPYNKVKDANKIKTLVENTQTLNLNAYIKNDLPTNTEIKNIIKKYAEMFPEDFRNGLDEIKVAKSKSYMMQHSMAYNARTGEWVKGSTISLSSHTFTNGFNPLEELRGALGAIKQGAALTFNQEYAIESLWHEILHAKTKSKPLHLDQFQIKNMETINQFIARHTYGGFIKRLGGTANNNTEILERGYGYSSWVSEFRNRLETKNISEEKAVEYFMPHLMSDYSKIGINIRNFFS